jgi:serine protease Do
VYKNTVRSVVIIVNYQGETAVSLGSGFVLDAGGHIVIVTNAHVVQGASSLKVRTYDGRSSILTSAITVDEGRDIALLPVPQVFAGIPGLRLAESPPKVGDAVFAVGVPQGLTFTFTKGIVSQFRRNFRPYGSVVQTDANISGGSSGGPLVDRNARVVGVNTLASRATVEEAHNLNFAVSAEEVAAVCNGTSDTQRRRAEVQGLQPQPTVGQQPATAGDDWSQRPKADAEARRRLKLIQQARKLGLPLVTTPQEEAQLPAGTLYLGPDGQVYQRRRPQ